MTSRRAPRRVGRPSALQPDTERDVHDLISLTKALVGTMTGFYDHLHLDDPAVVDRTIFIDTLGVRATDFDIDRATQQKLYDNGHAAAEQFLATWDWAAYLDKHRSRPVPAQAAPVDLTSSMDGAPSAT